MFVLRGVSAAARLLALGFVLLVAACGHLPSGKGGSRSDRECMARVMYFESIRSSDEGMLAVGTVVMNRLESDQYPKTVCGVVGEKNQFAPGVLSKPMQEGKSRERAYRVADEVLRGKRHRSVGKAMFFHTAGRTYHYTNMHYVAVAGGNAFYERKPTRRNYIPRTVIAQAGPRDSISAGRWGGTEIASLERRERPAAAARAPAPAPVPAPAPAVVARAPMPAPVPAARSSAPAPVVVPQPASPMSIEALILADAF